MDYSAAYLFLDMDGVLSRAHECRTGKMYNINKDCLALLQKFKAETNINVVISSSWRIVKTRWYFEKQFGFKLADEWFTPCSLPKEFYDEWDGRGNDIIEYLKENNLEDSKYVILDDDSDFFPWQPLVKTEFETGLLEEHIEKMKEILSKQ